MEDEDKPLPYVMPSVTESSFLELRELMKLEEEFPRTHEEWTAFWDDRRREEEGNGYKVRFVPIDVRAFSGFCKTRKKPGSWATLAEYLSAKAGR
jgi:hypothetical protein